MKTHFKATVILDIELEVPKKYEEFYTENYCGIWTQEEEDAGKWETKAVFAECERICGDNLEDIYEYWN